MSKNKRIVIALIISLILLIVLNIIYSNKIKDKEIKAYMLTQDVVSGEKVSLDKLKGIKISCEKNVLDFITEINEQQYFQTGLKKRTNIN